MRKKPTFNDFIGDFFKENPEALEIAKELPPNEDGLLFSKELREAMKPFEKMDVRDCIRSKDFMKALCNHAGMSDEEFNNILNSCKE